MTSRARGLAQFLSALLIVFSPSGSGRAADDLTERARTLHREAIVVDGHEDVPLALQLKWADLAEPVATRHVDIPRLKEGGVTAAFFAVYVAPSREAAGTAAKKALEAIDLVDRVVASHPETFVSATTAAGIRAAKKSGKIAILKGLEGGYAIENSLAFVRTFGRLGVRYMTLTHSGQTAWADSSGNFWAHDWDPKKTAVHGGLTEFGRRVVREMNRIGIAVDVSHASDDVVAQAIEVSRAPVFASHSSCRAISDMPRNLTDDQIRAIGARGGVVMINPGSDFLDQRAADSMRGYLRSIGPKIEALRAKYAADPKKLEEESEALWNDFKPAPVPWTKVVDHLEHVMRIAPGAAGIGSDFDGVVDLPDGFEDVSRLPRITEELLRRGHSESEIKGVLGENFLRFFERVEGAAASLVKESPDVTPFEVKR